MNTLAYFKEQFDQLLLADKNSGLDTLRQDGFNAFSKFGIPNAKHEEWKYTRIGGLFNREYQFPSAAVSTTVSVADVDAIRLPGNEEANELVFVNGIFSPSLSFIRSKSLVVQPLGEAAENKYAPVVTKHLGHSSKYLKDGINALNTAFVQEGVFIHVEKAKAPEHPVYIYNIADARTFNVFAQPRSLVHIAEKA